MVYCSVNGKSQVYSGPMYKSMNIETDRIRIKFDHIGSGLVSSDKEDLTWFQIAGKNRLFHPAKAIIDNNTVIVYSENVKEPVAVRFAWNEIAQPNLSNKEGLPAGPFRTDE